MANIPEPINPGFPAVHMWDVDEDVLGGSDGDATRPIKQLVERTAYLNKIAQEEAAEVDQEFEEVNQKLEAMKGRGGYLTAHDFGVANPTQEALTNYALSQIGKEDPLEILDQIHVKNTKNGHVWILNNKPASGEEEEAVFQWVDGGLDSVSIASDEIAGVVKTGTDFDSVNIDAEGRLFVPGLRTFDVPNVDGQGKDLMKVLLGHGFEEMTTQALKNEAITDVMERIRYRMNNNNEIDGSGKAYLDGLKDAYFLDGIDLSGCAAPTGGTAPQAWTEQYKNNRVEIAAFNPYKGVGDTENVKNHIMFAFRHCIAKGRMNSSDTNTNGYQASELRTWLEGSNGDGSGVFATKLKAALGGNYLYTIRKAHSQKGSYSWKGYTVFLLSEIELLGFQTYGDELVQYNTNLHLPLFKESYDRLIKRHNGSRQWYWTQTPSASNSTDFVRVNGNGYVYYIKASGTDGGVAPAFCVA